jgi:hypothetical protein
MVLRSYLACGGALFVADLGTARLSSRVSIVAFRDMR